MHFCLSIVNQKIYNSFMKFDFSLLSKITAVIKERTVGNRIGNIAIINSRDFLISFTAAREEKLLVSLNHQNPFASYISFDESIPTIIGTTNDTLRRELKDALILDVAILNDDKIICFNLQKTNDYFEREKKNLIIEFISQRCNLILTDENNTILFALNYSPLESVRPLMKGLKYELPNKKDTLMQSKSSTTLEELKSFAEKYIRESIQKRLLERYDVLFKHIKSRIKSQKNKLKVLEVEINTAKQNLRYQEVGNMLLALQNDENELKNYAKVEQIVLNPDFTVGQNANVFFKKYKKAKRTIEMDTIELNKATNEIEKLEVISSQTPYMSDEDLYELAMELMPGKFLAQKNKKPISKISYIEVDGAKIYFGKNAKQNNEITFKIAKPSYTYLHIKDYHGSHVVIANDSPTKEQLLTACEICLILSNKSVGDIMYSPISYVKKGNSLGEAFLKKYETITLTSIRENTYSELKSFKSK